MYSLYFLVDVVVVVIVVVWDASPEKYVKTILGAEKKTSSGRIF